MSSTVAQYRSLGEPSCDYTLEIIRSRLSTGLTWVRFPPRQVMTQEHDIGVAHHVALLLVVMAERNKAASFPAPADVLNEHWHESENYNPHWPAESWPHPLCDSLASKASDCGSSGWLVPSTVYNDWTVIAHDSGNRTQQSIEGENYGEAGLHGASPYRHTSADAHNKRGYLYLTSIRSWHRSSRT
jgi:hypothetical protein